jgi:hypothetical protein
MNRTVMQCEYCRVRDAYHKGKAVLSMKLEACLEIFRRLGASADDIKRMTETASLAVERKRNKTQTQYDTRRRDMNTAAERVNAW